MAQSKETLLVKGLSGTIRWLLIGPAVDRCQLTWVIQYHQ